MKIYVASRWRALRAAGVPIVASWISSSPIARDRLSVAVFAEGGFVANWAAATKAGWLETQRNGVREFHLPRLPTLRGG